MNGTQTELDAATQPSAAPAPAAAPAAGAPSKSALMQMEGRGVVLTNVEQALIFAKAVMTSGLAPSAFKTPEAVRNEVINAIRTFGTRGYVIGPDQEIADNTPVENIVTLYKAISDYKL